MTPIKRGVKTIRVISEPTCLPDGEACDALSTMLGDQKGADEALTVVVQEAFDAGRVFEKNRVQPACSPARPVKHETPSKLMATVPTFREWDAMDEDAPANPLETFRYHQMPSLEGGGNPEAFDAQLRAAITWVLSNG